MRLLQVGCDAAHAVMVVQGYTLQVWPSSVLVHLAVPVMRVLLCHSLLLGLEACRRINTPQRAAKLRKEVQKQEHEDQTYLSEAFDGLLFFMRFALSIVQYCIKACCHFAWALFSSPSLQQTISGMCTADLQGGAHIIRSRSESLCNPC